MIIAAVGFITMLGFRCWQNSTPHSSLLLSLLFSAECKTNFIGFAFMRRRNRARSFFHQTCLRSACKICMSMKIVQSIKTRESPCSSEKIWIYLALHSHIRLYNPILHYKTQPQLQTRNEVFSIGHLINACIVRVTSHRTAIIFHSHTWSPI